MPVEPVRDLFDEASIPPDAQSIDMQVRQALRSAFEAMVNHRDNELSEKFGAFYDFLRRKYTRQANGTPIV